ncbi:MAG: hypothetical protein H0W86_07855 [Armatimonadetes bacterium]|nr:hypothetical protein [Armatimonadota bacterium]
MKRFLVISTAAAARGEIRVKIGFAHRLFGVTICLFALATAGVGQVTEAWVARYNGSSNDDIAGALAVAALAVLGQCQDQAGTSASDVRAAPEVSGRQRTAAALLDLSGQQLVQLDQLWDFVNAKREKQEMKHAKSPRTSPRDMNNSEREIRKAFDTVQREAKRLLSAGQVYLLEQRSAELRSAPETSYRALYQMGFAEYSTTPIDYDAARRWRDSDDAFGKRPKSSPPPLNRYWGSGLGFGFGHHHHHHGGRRH